MRPIRHIVLAFQLFAALVWAGFGMLCPQAVTPADIAVTIVWAVLIAVLAAGYYAEYLTRR